MENRWTHAPEFSGSFSIKQKSGCSLHGATEGPMGPQIFVGYVWYQNHLMWVKQCHVYHPPAITIFIGGMSTIPNGWFMALF